MLAGMNRRFHYWLVATYRLWVKKRLQFTTSHVNHIADVVASGFKPTRNLFINPFELFVGEVNAAFRHGAFVQLAALLSRFRSGATL